MNQLKRAWELFINNPQLLLIVLFQILIVVPIILALVLFIFLIFLFKQSMIAGALVMGLFGVLFMLFFLFYTVFTNALLYGSLYNVVKNGRVTVLEMFKSMRNIYWRMFGYTLIIMALSLPALAMMLIAFIAFIRFLPFNIGGYIPAIGISIWTGIMFILVALAWLLVLALVLFWAPTYLPEHGTIDSIKKSWWLLAHKPGHTIVTVLVIIGFTIAVAAVSIIFGFIPVIGTIVVNLASFVLGIYISLYIFLRRVEADPFLKGD